MDPEPAVAFLEQWGYPALGILLGATGIGSPIPEDLLLLVAGYLIAADVFSWRSTLPLAYAGVVGSDCMLYWIGTQIRTHSLRWASRFIRPGRLDVIAPWFRYGDAIVFLARLVPGTRALVFVSSGARAMPFRRFLFFDALGAAVWVPLLLWAGAQIGEEIGGMQPLLAFIARTGWWLVVAAVALAVAWKLFRTEESKL